MAQSVQCLPQEPTHSDKNSGLVLCSSSPKAGGQRKSDPWSSLASQCNHNDELKVGSMANLVSENEVGLAWRLRGSSCTGLTTDLILRTLRESRQPLLSSLGEAVGLHEAKTLWDHKHIPILCTYKIYNAPNTHIHNLNKTTQITTTNNMKVKSKLPDTKYLASTYKFICMYMCIPTWTHTYISSKYTLIISFKKKNISPF